MNTQKHVISFAVLVILALLMIMPASGWTCGDFGHPLGTAQCPEHNVIDDMPDLGVTVPVTVNVPAPVVNVESAVPDIIVNPSDVIVQQDINNINKNINTNLNVNINHNDVDVDQSQSQNQNQAQFQLQIQHQDQKQKQDQGQSQMQSIYQPITINLPKDVKIDQLDVGEASQYSRLVYPQEVITFPISGGEVISMISGGPVAVYTIATTSRDEKVALQSSETIPNYDPIYHKMEWGMITPLDAVDYYTTKATMTASYGAAYFVVDNRGSNRPAPSYTMVEVTTIPCKDDGCPLPPQEAQPRSGYIGTIETVPIRDYSGVVP